MKVEIKAGLITFAILLGIILFVMLFTLYPYVMGNVLFYGVVSIGLILAVTVLYNGILLLID